MEVKTSNPLQTVQMNDVHHDDDVNIISFDNSGASSEGSRQQRSGKRYRHITQDEDIEAQESRTTTSTRRQTLDANNGPRSHGVALSEESYLDRICTWLFDRILREASKKPFQYFIGLTVAALLAYLIYEMVAIIHGKSPVTTTDSLQWTDFLAKSLTGAVATDNDQCSQVGVDILAQGGNAIDAAVAAALCLGVVNPASSGLGGGCFILIHNATTNRQEFIDARETAPAAASQNMFISDPILAQDGGLAVATLGELKGLHLAWQRHGSANSGSGSGVPWSNLVQPSARIAMSMTMTEELLYYVGTILPQLQSGDYPELTELLLDETKNPKPLGASIARKTLSETLQKIADDGAEYIYSTMAGQLAAEIQAAGGIVTESDIRNFSAIVRDPLTTEFMGYHYVGVGGSSSGGPAVAGMLKFLGSYLEPLVSERGLYYHRLVEAMKHCFAIRQSLGDPAFVNTTGPLAALTSDSFMSSLQALTKDTNVLPLVSYGGVYNIEAAPMKRVDQGTSHLCVVDRWGNAVALTSTVNTPFGSKVVSPSTGILFNNEMDDFSIPNASNYFGLSPNINDYPEPFKRPLSSMSPSMIFQKIRDVDISISSGVGSKVGKLRLLGGASGGPRIITGTVQVILNVIGLGMDVLTAVRHPRVHTQLLPDEVDVENHAIFGGLRIDSDSLVYTSLTSRNHSNVVNTSSVGVTQFIEILPDSGEIWAVSDPRKGGRPAGLT